MIKYFNWKTGLLLFAFLFVSATLYFGNVLATRLEKEEKNRVELVIAALKTSNSTTCPSEMGFAVEVMQRNTTIPLIITNSEGEVTSHINIDSNKKGDTKNKIQELIQEYKTKRPPLELDFGLGKNYVYYGESNLLTQLRFFPYVQLATMLLFVIIVLFAISTAQKSMQNQVWVGLSKETAHQLGTPLSSLEGWIAMLQEEQVNPEALRDMQKDLDRLKLVADRFAKIGNTPELVEEDLVPRLANMVDYMQKRSPQKVKIIFTHGEEPIHVNLNGPLFDWVIENLIRNALDALEGQGTITLTVTNNVREVTIDVDDTGKGIAGGNWQKVFKPGYSTKKRGWGLGLSLAKRIVEQYHSGSIFVKSSEQGKGTKFRIILRR